MALCPIELIFRQKSLCKVKSSHHHGILLVLTTLACTTSRRRLPLDRCCCCILVAKSSFLFCSLHVQHPDVANADMISYV